jgi:hypothetical protein
MEEKILKNLAMTNALAYFSSTQRVGDEEKKKFLPA